MYVQIATLADAANTTEQDKMNILGIFDTALVEGVPCRLPDLCLAIKFMVEYRDSGGHDLCIRLRDTEGRTIQKYENIVIVEEMSHGETGHVNHIVSVQGLIVHEPGNYTFDIRWDESLLTSVPFVVLVDGTEGGGVCVGPDGDDDREVGDAEGGLGGLGNSQGRWLL